MTPEETNAQKHPEHLKRVPRLRNHHQKPSSPGQLPLFPNVPTETVDTGFDPFEEVAPKEGETVQEWIEHEPLDW